ncbi:MAG: hypothetical protein NZ765_09590 [Anaerolineae bacterium]|nr:hypothetical protein [Anaerolineae bacterium]MDW8071840.1 hypothetical protein [Anaerolineae bacterium]
MSTVGPWPSPGDYSAAIQNPHNCFADPELKKGQVQTDSFGLPLGVSGNFAVVYQLQSGTEVFAVRCFIRSVTDQQRRYDALSQYLQGIWLPHLVHFTYLAQGIRVRGQWYPVVKMEWVSGRQLHHYVESCLSQPHRLGQLAARWRGVIAGLSGARIAHGDLQHGNVLVDGEGSIRLVDYDGIFLPALRGSPPGEVGHVNYQHPERIVRSYYEANVDAFPALVIYLSLLALKAEPGLWQAFHTGENLIFQAADFRKPGQTPLWKRLQSSPDAEVQRLAAELERFCQGSVAAVPDLETVVQGLSRVPVPPPSPTSVVPLQPSAPVVPARPPTTVACPHCGFVNDATEIYCQRCAHQLCGNRWCPHCNGSVPVRAQYCTECGQRV